MARRAVRLLCLAVVLVAVLFFHPDAAAEGKEEPPARLHRVVSSHCRCRTSEVTRVDVANNSPVNKVPEISEIIGIAENFCKPVADDVLVIAENVKLVFQDEKWDRCDAKCREKIKHGLLEAMKHYNDLIEFIYCNRPSIQQLKEYICKSHAGEDNNESRSETMIKYIGSKVKELPSWLWTLWQKEEPVELAKACKKLKHFPEVKFDITF